MVEDKKNTTKKKTLSLKLGSSIKSNPAKIFESGSTVIVERKRVRKNIFSSPENIIQENKSSQNLETKEIDEPKKNVEAPEVKKSGKILKRLSKEEQKKLQEAKNAADKKNVLKEIGGIINEQPEEIINKPEIIVKEEVDEQNKTNENISKPSLIEPESIDDQKDKKKPSTGFGRKNLR